MSSATPARGTRSGPDHVIHDRIILAATEHFRLYGFEKTTVSDLANAIGYSKAYIYKFFDSKQAIGEVICVNCLEKITEAVDRSVRAGKSSSDQIRRMFRALVDANATLFSDDRKLYDIAAVAARDRWPAVDAFEEHLRRTLAQILKEGRESGEFERKTPLDETVAATFLVMLPYANPLLSQHSLDHAKDAALQLASLILRSLTP
ncbi:TetR/AcrR family transcriptional regulator [Pendulispora brunnea]|uniref:TetR/AcrR family transcriptional regulator n=1 Tax=Pendulispora brunnea TaxID=2905690 RepID=A0ABZ2K6E3_9BACT